MYDTLLDTGNIEGAAAAYGQIRGVLQEIVAEWIRQGISIELADVREWFTNGLTGIEIVDLWIMSVNPYKSKRPSRITSPDRAVAARFR